MSRISGITRYLKRILSLLFVFAFLSFPSTGYAVEYDSSMSFQEKISVLRNSFTSGWYWNHWSDSEINNNNIQQKTITLSGVTTTISNKACSHSNTTSHDNKFDGATQCNGYGRLLYYLVWGSSPSKGYRLTNSEKDNFLDYVDEGDVIIFDVKKVYHWIFVTAVDHKNNEITFTDCNWGNCCNIRWGVTWTKQYIYDIISQSEGKEGILRSHYPFTDRPFNTTIKITTQPISGTFALGDTATTTVIAEGEDLSYEWYKKEPGASIFVNTSITSNTYSQIMTSENSGTQVYCEITDKKGSTLKTDTVTLSVAQQSAPTIEYVVIYTGAGLRIRQNPGLNGEQIGLMAKGTHFWVHTGTETEMDNYTWAYIHTEDNREGWTAISNPDHCIPVLKVTTQPTSKSGAVGSTVTLSLSATGTGLTYQWQ